MIVDIIPLPTRLLCQQPTDAGVGTYFRSTISQSNNGLKYIGTNIARLNNKQSELFTYKIIEQFGNIFIERIVITREPWDMRDKRVCLTQVLMRLYSQYMVETIVPISVFNILESKSFRPINFRNGSDIVNNVVTSDSLNTTIMRSIMSELNSSNKMLGNYVEEYIQPKLNVLDKYVNLNFRFIERPDEFIPTINEPTALVNNICSEIEDSWYATIRHNESTNLIDDTIDNYFDNTDVAVNPLFRSSLTHILRDGACLSAELAKQFGHVNTAMNKVQFYCPVTGIVDFDKSNSIEWDLLPYCAEIAYFMDCITMLGVTDFCLEFNQLEIKRARHGIPLLEWTCNTINTMNRYHPHNTVSTDITWRMEYAGSHLLSWLTSIQRVKLEGLSGVKIIKTYGEELFIVLAIGNGKQYVYYFNMIEAYLCNRDILHSPKLNNSTIDTTNYTNDIYPHLDNNVRTQQHQTAEVLFK